MSKSAATVLGLLLGLVASVSALALDASIRGLLSAGRADDVIRAANLRIKNSPQDADAYHAMARAYFQLQNWDKALEASERAIAFSPQNSDYHMWLGRVYGEKADHASFLTAMGWAKKARREFEQAVKLDPSNVPAHSDLAEFYIDAPGFIGGGTDKARKEADFIERRDPGLAHYLRAAIANKEGDHGRVEQEMRAAIQTGQDKARFWLNLASFYRHWKRYDDMEKAINSAMAADRIRSDVVFYAAEMLVRTGRNFSGAEQLLRTYLRAPDEDAPAFEAHYVLGTLLEKQGKKDEAIREYRAALSLAAEFEDARKALARLQ